MDRLWRPLSGYHVEICATHAVGSYDPFGEHYSSYNLSLYHLLGLTPAPSWIRPSLFHLLRCTSASITAVHPAASPSGTVKRHRVQHPPIHHPNARYTPQRHLIKCYIHIHMHIIHTFLLYFAHIYLRTVQQSYFVHFASKGLVNGYTRG
jgi:hypothetical protein